MTRVFSKMPEGKNLSLEASKWIKIPAFLTAEELEELFLFLDTFHLLPLGRVQENLFLSKKAFVQEYQKTLENLDQRVTLTPLALTKDCEDIYHVSVGERGLLKIKNPVIQVSSHYFRYSDVDQTFRSGVYAEDSVFWGLHFCFPQIYQTEKRELKETKDSENGLLFHRLRKWIRTNTLPMPFLVNGKRVVTTMRIGKKAFPKIESHPHLIRENIQVGAFPHAH